MYGEISPKCLETKDYDVCLQYFYLIFPNKYVLYVCIWASLIAQLVKNLPAIQETPVQLRGREDPIQSQRKAMPKNAQTTAQLHSSHMLAK